MASCQHLLPPRTIVVAEVYKVQLGVGEVHSLRRRIESQTVRPVDLGSDDSQPLGSIHPDALDPRVLSPVGPEQPPRVGCRVEAHASRLRDVSAQQCRPGSAILFGDLDSVQFAIQPINISSDPVVSEALDQIQPRGYNHVGFSASVQPRDLLQFHVGPEYGSSMHVGSGGDNVFHVDWDSLEALLVEISDEDGVAIGNDEKSARMIVGLAGVFIDAQLVAVDAAAVVRLLNVSAELRAGTGRAALVYVAARQPVGLQFLARGAQAEWSVGRLPALVGAQPRLVLALGGLAGRTCKVRASLPERACA